MSADFERYPNGKATNVLGNKEKIEILDYSLPTI